MYKFFLLLLLYCVLGCSVKKERKEDATISSTDSVDHYNELQEQSVSYTYTGTDSEDANIKIPITSIEVTPNIRRVKILIENSTSDTLNLNNRLYQIEVNNSWETIPCAFEDIGWIIPPQSKTIHDCFLPLDYTLTSGNYRLNFTFSNKKNLLYHVRTGFELIISPNKETVPLH